MKGGTSLLGAVQLGSPSTPQPPQPLLELGNGYVFLDLYPLEGVAGSGACVAADACPCHFRAKNVHE